MLGRLRVLRMARSSVRWLSDSGGAWATRCSMCAVTLSGSVRWGGEAGVGVGWGCVSLWWFFRLVGARVGGLLPVGLWWVWVLVRDSAGVYRGLPGEGGRPRWAVWSVAVGWVLSVGVVAVSGRASGCCYCG